MLTLWRNRLTPDFLATLNLNDRQMQALAYVREAGRITNAEHRRLTGAIPKTATRDLEGLVEKGLLARGGEKRGAHYVLVAKK